MGNQFKKGDRVRVVSVSGFDEKAGVKVGMCGEVVRVDDDEIIVTFDGVTIFGEHKRDDGYFMVESQLEAAPQRKFKVGDRVRITRIARSYENGWEYPWVSRMDDLVGKVGTVVRDDGRNGIVVKVDGDTWVHSYIWFPAFVLEAFDPIADALARDNFKFTSNDSLTPRLAVRNGEFWATTWCGMPCHYDTNAVEKLLRGNVWLLIDEVQPAQLEPGYIMELPPGMKIAAEPRAFKVGDKVRVVRKIEGHTNGWNNTWIAIMDAAIGKTAIVGRHCGSLGLKLQFESVDGFASECSYPPEALELVTKSKADELVEALAAAKAKTKAANDRVNELQKELSKARDELHVALEEQVGAEHALFDHAA